MLSEKQIELKIRGSGCHDYTLVQMFWLPGQLTGYDLSGCHYSRLVLDAMIVHVDWFLFFFVFHDRLVLDDMTIDWFWCFCFPLQTGSGCHDSRLVLVFLFCMTDWFWCFRPRIVNWRES